MRLNDWVMLSGLATAMVLTTACGGGDDDDDDTNVVIGDDDDDDGDDDDDDDVETAVRIEWYVGQATVDADSYVGYESFVFTGDADVLLCEYTWQATGALPVTLPLCTDPDGNPCDFAFEVSLTEGVPTGGDCDLYFDQMSAELGPYPYGFISDYQIDGYSDGPSMMYYYSYGNYVGWYWLVGSYADYDANSGQFEYEILWDYYFYAL